MKIAANLGIKLKLLSAPDLEQKQPIQSKLDG